jgi:hypothetical protein
MIMWMPVKVKLLPFNLYDSYTILRIISGVADPGSCDKNRCTRIDDPAQGVEGRPLWVRQAGVRSAFG